MYSIAFKVSYGNYWDEDNYDEIITEIQSNNIPQIGDIIDLQNSKSKEDKYNRKSYLVREIKRIITIKPFEEWIYVYVISNES